MKLKKHERIFLYSAVFLMLLAVIYQRIQIAFDSPRLIPESEKIILPKAVVAVVQSSKENVWDLNYADIKLLVKNAVEKAGGFEKLISNGDVVVLKPNLMTLWINSTKEMLLPDANGITTDWRITKAVSELVRERNRDGKIYVMESSAFQQTKMAMDSLKYTREFIPEVDEFICLEKTGKYEEWDSPELVRVTLPKGVGLYPDMMNVNMSNVFYVNRVYYEADVVIDMPVLKGHTHTGISGAIKNVGIGASPPTIYGKLQKIAVTEATPSVVLANPDNRIALIRSAKINHQPYYLDKWIHDYYLCRPVDFVITDGLQAIENGPDISRLTKAKDLKSSQMNMRMIIAGKDAVAVDAVHSLLIGHDPYKIIHLLHLEKSGAGVVNPAYIRVKGNLVHEVKKDFAMTNERGEATKYYDFEPPGLKVNSIKRSGKNLNLSLAVDEETIKVELAVDGNFLDEMILHGFDDITVDIGRLKKGEHKVKVYAYDRFLNCSVEEVSIY